MGTLEHSCPMAVDPLPRTHRIAVDRESHASLDGARFTRIANGHTLDRRMLVDLMQTIMLGRRLLRPSSSCVSTTMTRLQWKPERGAFTGPAWISLHGLATAIGLYLAVGPIGHVGRRLRLPRSPPNLFRISQPPRTNKRSLRAKTASPSVLPAR